MFLPISKTTLINTNCIKSIEQHYKGDLIKWADSPTINCSHECTHDQTVIWTTNDKPLFSDYSLSEISTMLGV